MENGYWFRSNLFKITAGEDEKTNPGCYGKSLAEWLCTKFSKLGYKPKVIADDWGWCVMCTTEEYMLWIGCGSTREHELIENYNPKIPPDTKDVIWHVFPTVEIPFFMIKSKIRKWLGMLDTNTPFEKLSLDLEKVLSSEDKIEFCEEPEL